MSTASISGTRPAAGEAPYAAAKAAVAALTATAALEYAPTVRVNAVSPGMIATPMTTLLLEERGLGRAEQMAAKTPLDRVGAPEDIADVVVFLCSDLARFVTGQNIVIDGGMTLPRIRGRRRVRHRPRSHGPALTAPSHAPHNPRRCCWS